MQDLGIERKGVGRGRQRAGECAHASPVLVERVRHNGHDGYGARCLVCGSVGPARNSPEESRDALQAASR